MDEAAPSGASRHHERRPPRRALVTRPRAEAAELAAVLAVRGIAAVIEPLLEIAYRDTPAPDFAGVQAILCTSSNGVRALARLSGERQLPLFAVGAASAHEALVQGFARVEGAGGGSAADLARLVVDRLSPAAGKLLHAAGSAVAGDLAGELRAHGFAVERVVLYEAHAATELSAATKAALAEGAIDFALFFSPRTAATFVRLVKDAGLATVVSAVTAVSISSAANAALDPLRFRARLVADHPSEAALLAMLDHFPISRSSGA